MQKKILLSSIIVFGVILASLHAMGQNGLLPFAVTPEEKGNFDGNHQFPVIKGSIFLGEDFSGNLSSKVGISQQNAEAAALAYTTGGKVLSTNLGVENGYLVYTVTVLFQGQQYQVIVDAGDGSVLFASQDTGQEAGKEASPENGE